VAAMSWFQMGKGAGVGAAVWVMGAVAEEEC
jgi:hypothetical protein